MSDTFPSPDDQPSDDTDATRRLPVDGNIAGRLTMVASLAPGAIAIAEPDGPPQPGGLRSYSLTTFGSLDQRSDAIARGLTAWGVKPGMRIAMLVPFGAGFIELVFSLMKAGVVTVLVDPGMGRKHLVRCLNAADPDGFIGIPKAQAIRSVLRRRFPKAKWNVTVGRRLFWGGKTLQQVIELGKARKDNINLPRVERSDDAAVIFHDRQHGTSERRPLHSWNLPCTDRQNPRTIRHPSRFTGLSLLSTLWFVRCSDGRDHHHP